MCIFADKDAATGDRHRDTLRQSVSDLFNERYRECK